MMAEAAVVSVSQSIGDVYTGLMQAVGASEKVFEFIDRKPLIATGAGTYQPEQMEGKVEFRNVTFAYPSRPDAQVLNVGRSLVLCTHRASGSRPDVFAPDKSIGWPLSMAKQVVFAAQLGT